MLNQLVQIPNQLLSHLDGLVQTDSPWLDRSTIKSVGGGSFRCGAPIECQATTASGVSAGGLENFLSPNSSEDNCVVRSHEARETILITRRLTCQLCPPIEPIDRKSSSALCDRGSLTANRNGPNVDSAKPLALWWRVNQTRTYPSLYQIGFSASTVRTREPPHRFSY